MTDLLSHQQLPVTGGELHVVEGGPPEAPGILFLHGWPEDASAFERLMTLAGPTFRVVALDLPGIGGSRLDHAPGDKRSIATVVREAVRKLGLKDLTLVGHDVGGMVTYAYLRAFPQDLKRAVIMDTVIPGLDPWDEVLRNPYIWHFAFHSIPGLPETLVQGKQAEYFAFFYETIVSRKDAIGPEARARYAAAYSKPQALTTGFDWYRAFPQDAEENAADTSSVSVPLLYLRGEKEGGDIQQYVQSFQKAGVQQVQSAVIEGVGHFAAEENPEALWQQLSAFIAETV